MAQDKMDIKEALTAQKISAPPEKPAETKEGRLAQIQEHRSNVASGIIAAPAEPEIPADVTDPALRSSMRRHALKNRPGTVTVAGQPIPRFAGQEEPLTLANTESPGNARVSGELKTEKVSGTTPKQPNA